MTQSSNFRIDEYIKKHRESDTRYTIDLYLLGKGFDARMIDDAWKTVSGNAKRKRPAFLIYLFQVIFISNGLSWFSIFFLSWESEAVKLNKFIHYPIGQLGEFPEIAYQWGLNPVLFFVALILWTFLIATTVWSKTYKTKYLKEPLVISLVSLVFMFAYTLITIGMTFSHLNWAGPAFLIISLVIGLVSTSLKLKYLDQHQEIPIYSKGFH